MNSLQNIKSHLEPGLVYRRADLMKWSKAVDRHLLLLQKDKSLRKLSGGLYYCPKKSTFGETPPSERELVEAFLKESRFLIFSSDVYNGLGVGTTQLYNETLVYNHKRHGNFKLGNRTYKFVIKHHFPETLSETFLYVDLVNNITHLAEDRDHILKLVASRAKEMNEDELRSAVEAYGGVRAKKFFFQVIEAMSPSDVH